MGFFDGLGGALISGAASLLGGERRNDAAADQAAAANAFSAQQYATRYQTTVKDMQAAGLNPMLAYSQGPGASPSGQQAQMQDTITPAVSAFQVQRMNNAQVQNIEADTTNKEAQAANIRADTMLKVAQEAFTGASADQARANIGYLEAQSKKIVEETKNVPKEGDRLVALVKNLGAEYQNIVERTHNTVEATKQMRWLAVKTMLEGDLLNFDISAAKSLDNLGRESQQLRPVIEMVIGVLRSMRGSK